MASRIVRHTEDARRLAAEALEELTDSLRLVDVLFPSLGVDWTRGRQTGVFLVDMGAARPDVALKLARVIRAGAGLVRD